MNNQEIINQAINVLEKDAALIGFLHKNENPFMIFTKAQLEIFAGMEELSNQTAELLKQIKL